MLCMFSHSKEKVYYFSISQYMKFNGSGYKGSISFLMRWRIIPSRVLIASAGVLGESKPGIS